jgi:hypothetical protein
MQIMTISSIMLYEVLAEQLGKEKAKTLVDFVEVKIEEGLKDKTSLFSTKEDIVKMEARLETKIADSKSEMIKWMFIFWVGSVGVLSGIMFALLNAYLK